MGFTLASGGFVSDASGSTVLYSDLQTPVLDPLTMEMTLGHRRVLNVYRSPGPNTASAQPSHVLI